jgi:hypothetical protein
LPLGRIADLLIASQSKTLLIHSRYRSLSAPLPLRRV